MTIILGIDVGGTGIKGAPVNTETGELVGERFRVLTPQPATPDAVAASVAQVIHHFDGVDYSKERFGLGFPAVVKNGVTYSAANVDHAWIGCDAKTVFEQHTGMKATVLNDADAAGLAEVRYGAGRDKKGVILMLTFGTGIGSALFVDGRLIPNTELGHMEIRGKDAEHRASDAVRIERELSWRKWALRVDEYLHLIEKALFPDLIIIGGGASKNANKFIPRLTINAPVVPAELLNEAGIVGAALAVELGYT
jgi:polyphosphate glucokinase